MKMRTGVKLRAKQLLQMLEGSLMLIRRETEAIASQRVRAHRRSISIRGVITFHGFVDMFASEMYNTTIE